MNNNCEINSDYEINKEIYKYLRLLRDGFSGNFRFNTKTEYEWFKKEIASRETFMLIDHTKMREEIYDWLEKKTKQNKRIIGTRKLLTSFFKNVV